MKIEYAVAALRVSSNKQGLEGDSQIDQKKQIQLHSERVSAMTGKDIRIKKWFKFTQSASGDLDVQPIVEAIEYCKNSDKKISYFFVKSLDRFTRGGSTVYGLLKMQLSKYGVQLLDTYGIVSTQKYNTLSHLDIEYDWSVYSPTYKTELLEAERAKDEIRDILTRMIGSEISYVRMGYRARSAPPGYINQKIETKHGNRTILAPHPEESLWFIRMFELRDQGSLDDKQIVKEINKMGFRTREQKKRDTEDKRKVIGYKGGNKMTVKHLQRYIKNPIYAGVNTEKWTNGNAVKCQFDGLVSIDLFNRANRGKVMIVEENDKVKVVEGKTPSWKVKRLKDNPEFAFKRYVLCPFCRKQLIGSAPQNKVGNHIPRYHCSRNHKYWSINRNKLDETVEKFVSEIEFNQRFMKKFNKVVLEEWNKRKERTQKDSISAEERVLKLKQEAFQITEKIKILSSETAIKALEKDLERVELEQAQATQNRNKKETEDVDIKTLINFTSYYVEHLEELILTGTNQLQNAAMFGLIFKEPPTYEELVNRTPKLAHIFALKQQYEASKEHSVTQGGVEPPTFSLEGNCSVH
jgi:site-specific DNA recombinase